MKSILFAIGVLTLSVSLAGATLITDPGFPAVPGGSQYTLDSVSINNEVWESDQVFDLIDGHTYTMTVTGHMDKGDMMPEMAETRATMMFFVDQYHYGVWDSSEETPLWQQISGITNVTDDGWRTWYTYTGQFTADVPIHPLLNQFPRTTALVMFLSGEIEDPDCQAQGWYSELAANPFHMNGDERVFEVNYMPATEQTQAPVPEPVSMALFGLGLAGAAGGKALRKRFARS